MPDPPPIPIFAPIYGRTLEHLPDCPAGRTGTTVDVCRPCHSGGAYNARLVNDAANAKIFVFSATDAETGSTRLGLHPFNERIGERPVFQLFELPR